MLKIPPGDLLQRLRPLQRDPSPLLPPDQTLGMIRHGLHLFQRVAEIPLRQSRQLRLKAIMPHKLLRDAEVFHQQRQSETRVVAPCDAVAPESVHGGEIDARPDVEDVDHLLRV